MCQCRGLHENVSAELTDRGNNDLTFETKELALLPRDVSQARCIRCDEDDHREKNNR